MNHIHLGATDLQIGEMGIGAWAWGDQLFWGFGKGYDQNDIHAAFETSLAAGIDFFDTAEIYGSGKSEKFLGQYLQDKRRQVVIATKFFPYPCAPRR